MGQLVRRLTVREALGALVLALRRWLAGVIAGKNSQLAAQYREYESLLLEQEERQRIAREQVWPQFHRLWTACAARKEYDKSEWSRLASLLTDLGLDDLTGPGRTQG